MIQSFKLNYHLFEPIRESQCDTYRYDWSGNLLRYHVKRQGRINYQEQGEHHLTDLDKGLLHDFLRTNDLLVNRKIKHDPYNHPSAFQGADGLDILMEYQIGGRLLQQQYKGTSVQLKPYAGILHELWRMVHHFIQKNQNV